MKFWAQNGGRTPYLQSLLPQAVLDDITRGVLPLLQCDGLQLTDGEFCHYADYAIYEKRIRRPRGTVRRQQPGIFRRQDGASAGRDTVIDIVFEQFDGYLYITSRRVLFAGGDELWERGLPELLAAKPYANCIKLQFGRDSFKIFVPDGNLACRVISLIRRNRE